MQAILDPDARDAYGTSRRSPLVRGLALVHADLHNHTKLSDGRGEAKSAFGSMRSAGLDAAAITDHAFLSQNGWGHGLDERGWRELEQLAATADDPGSFVAMRGYEWSHPYLGHMNVWGTPSWIGPASAGARDLERLYDWLQSTEAADALTSFNHPGGRGTVLRFNDFVLRQPLVPRMVGLEMFNKTDDYLFGGDDTAGSPLVQCLDQGWRPGLIGVTDEHGKDWGHPQGKGRTGLYVRELSRAGVQEALRARRTFAARVWGLRLASTLDGVLMGSAVERPADPTELPLEVDVDLGPLADGMELSLQLLRWGQGDPVVEEIGRIVSGAGVLCTGVRVHPDEPWLVLRVTDPSGRADGGAPRDVAGYGRSIAYASPFWIGR